jgi:hypothetical protein
MSRGALDHENPDRLYTVTGGRSRVAANTLDPVTLIVTESDPEPGLQSEHARILRMCRRPMAVVEIAAYLRLPVSVATILLCDLMDSGKVSARHPASALGPARLPELETLEQVLVGLQKL